MASQLNSEDARRIEELKHFLKPVVFVQEPMSITKIEHGADIPEAPPIHTTDIAIWELVINDMLQRDLMGAKKYGTRLQAFNGRDPLWDLYQELLDAVVYCRQAIYERDNPKTVPVVIKDGKEEDDGTTDHSEYDE